MLTSIRSPKRLFDRLLLQSCFLTPTQKQLAHYRSLAASAAAVNQLVPEVPDIDQLEAETSINDINRDHNIQPANNVDDVPPLPVIDIDRDDDNNDGEDENWDSLSVAAARRQRHLELTNQHSLPMVSCS